MEQQTISIAKAGITTILNSRTSVLAAANPSFGRYDDMKTAAEQIDFQTTILSRFDLIFVVKDSRAEAKDKRMAKHIMNLHMGVETAEQVGDIEVRDCLASPHNLCNTFTRYPSSSATSSTAEPECRLVLPSTRASHFATNLFQFDPSIERMSARAA